MARNGILQGIWKIPNLFHGWIWNEKEWMNSLQSHGSVYDKYERGKELPIVMCSGQTSSYK